METIEDKGWYVLNGTTRGDEEGEYTYVGKGNTVIDYCITNQRGWEEVEKFEVQEGIDSDHLPLCIYVGEEEREKEEEKKKTRTVISWTDEDKDTYLEKLKEWDRLALREMSVEEEWEELKKAIHNAMTKKESVVKEKKIGQWKWGDKECSKSKNQVKKKYRKWKRGKGTKEEYTEKRK